jgi:hypothetical protein
VLSPTQLIHKHLGEQGREQQTSAGRTISSTLRDYMYPSLKSG